LVSAKVNPRALTAYNECKSLDQIAHQFLREIALKDMDLR
jgi:hypothetical protein